MASADKISEGAPAIPKYWQPPHLQFNKTLFSIPSSSTINYDFIFQYLAACKQTIPIIQSTKLIK